jgi:hypothetical protein
MLGSSRVAAQLAASREGLGSMSEIVNISWNEKATFNGELEIIWDEEVLLVVKYCTMKFLIMEFTSLPLTLF